MKRIDHLQGIMFLILAQSLVGVNIVISKMLLTSMPVLILLAVRFLLASLVLLPLHWMTSAKSTPIKQHFSQLNKRDWGFIIAQALTAGIFFNCLMLSGLSYTDANVAGIITSVLPAIIAIMSWLILGEQISTQKVLCVVFATIGLIIIACDKLNGIGQSHSVLGDMIVLVSLLPEASYYVLCKLYSNKLPIFLTSALLNGINALILLPALFVVHWQPASMDIAHWFILFIISLSSGLFYVFWFLGSQKVDGVMASLSTAIMPVATVLLAWIILKEQLNVCEFLGMSLVIFSIVFYARR